ncbi:MAG: thiamine diphosphokinase [Chthonomonas sp.]|nr:thiamine diphosphokinase [Chthonomonas sp.]
MSRNLILLGGDDHGQTEADQWVRSADHIIAADGGANRLAAERAADLVVGDGDSISEAWRPHLTTDGDQETTDCEKALAAAKFLGHTEVTILGAEGDRLDHVLATLSACAASDLAIRLVLRLGFGYILRPGSRTVFPCEAGATISFLPLTECVASMLGTEWPVEGQKFAPGGFKSISNRALSASVSVVVESGVGLLFVHRSTDTPQWD